MSDKKNKPNIYLTETKDETEKDEDGFILPKNR